MERTIFDQIAAASFAFKVSSFACVSSGKKTVELDYIMSFSGAFLICLYKLFYTNELTSSCLHQRADAKNPQSSFPVLMFSIKAAAEAQ